MLDATRCPLCNGAIVAGWADGEPTCLMCGRRPGWEPRPAIAPRIGPMRQPKLPAGVPRIEPMRQPKRSAGVPRTDAWASAAVAARLTAFLDGRKMSYVAFARLAGVSKTTVTACVQGRGITSATIARIEAAITAEEGTDG
jgi:hypothetical protein